MGLKRMNIRDARARELAQWTTASDLLTEYGCEIGNFLRGRMAACFVNGDHPGASIWKEVSEKIVRLQYRTSGVEIH
jgi:hypothetical protein